MRANNKKKVIPLKIVTVIYLQLQFALNSSHGNVMKEITTHLWRYFILFNLLLLVLPLLRELHSSNSYVNIIKYSIIIEAPT